MHFHGQQSKQDTWMWGKWDTNPSLQLLFMKPSFPFSLYYEMKLLAYFFLLCCLSNFLVLSRQEVGKLEGQLSSARDQYLSMVQSATDSCFTALPEFAINDKFVLNQDEAWYTLSIETQVHFVGCQCNTKAYAGPPHTYLTVLNIFLIIRELVYVIAHCIYVHVVFVPAKRDGRPFYPMRNSSTCT